MTCCIGDFYITKGIIAEVVHERAATLARELGESVTVHDHQAKQECNVHCVTYEDGHTDDVQLSYDEDPWTN